MKTFVIYVLKPQLELELRLPLAQLRWLLQPAAVAYADVQPVAAEPVVELVAVEPVAAVAEFVAGDVVVVVAGAAVVGCVDGLLNFVRFLHRPPHFQSIQDLQLLLCQLKWNKYFIIIVL